MVNPAEFKKKIEQIVSQNYKIEFLGKNFDHTVALLTETKAEKIYRWLQEVIEKKIQPILVGSKKPYKEWKVSELLTFRYPFSIENTEYRILFVKVKNSIYTKSTKYSNIFIVLLYAQKLCVSGMPKTLFSSIYKCN